MMKRTYLFLVLLIGFAVNQLRAQNSIGGHFDNDLLYIPANDDREYTFGMGLVYGWEPKHTFKTKDNWQYRSLRAGIELYTPDNLRASEPLLRDRPYASTIFLEVNDFHFAERKGRLKQMAVQVGVLGMALAGRVQAEAHAMTRRLREQHYPADPKGWHNQISAGGEPTVKVSGQVKQRFFKRALPRLLQFKAEGKLELGTRTQLFSGLGFRIGKLRSQIWQAATQSILPLPLQDRNEFFLYSQAGINLVGYNAFLQGQFRSNPYQFTYQEIHPYIAEAETGFIFRNRFLQTGYGLHLSTREYKRSNMALHYWGTLFVAWQF